MLSTPTPQRAIIFNSFACSKISLVKVVPLRITMISALLISFRRSLLLLSDSEISKQLPILSNSFDTFGLSLSQIRIFILQSLIFLMLAYVTVRRLMLKRIHVHH